MTVRSTFIVNLTMLRAVKFVQLRLMERLIGRSVELRDSVLI